MRGSAEQVPVRSFRVVFRVERRIFRIDRWRLPFPGGVPLRLIGYGAVVWGSLLALRALPGVREVVGLVPAQVYWMLLPAALVWAAARLQVEGRPPHRALAGLVRWRLSP